MPDVMATAIALDLLGIGVCISAGPTCWPVRIVVGQSVKAQLLRAFLPLTVAIILFLGWFGEVDVTWTGNPELTASVVLLLALATVVVLASRTGQTVGERIDEANDALRESEERFRRITENMMDMVAQTDLQGICEYASPSFKTVLGYDPKDVLGKSLFELVHPNDLDNVLEIVRKALATSSTATFDYRYKHADGHYVWLESVGNPVFDETGQMTGTILATRDITERKRMQTDAEGIQKEVQGHRASSGDWIWEVDRDGKFTFVDWNCCSRCIGYSSEELIGKTPFRSSCHRMK